jgi:nitrogenase molybdenum-iron protein beta chain
MNDFVERPRAPCALGGALAAISSLPDVIPIVHTAAGCGGNLMNSVAMGAGYLGTSYCSGPSAPSSAITETEIVFGGNERLREQIASTLKLIEGKLYIAATGCMTEMIGDDAEGAVSEFADEAPIIAISTPSFKGDSYVGYEILLDGIFNKWLQKSGETNPKLVNVFGVVPGYDPFFRGDLEEIERIGARLGVTVNTFFSSTQTFDNITSAPSAALNIIFSRTRCRAFAEKFAERFGTPYWVTDLPVGPEAADNFIRELSAKLNVDSTTIESVIESENKWYYRYFERTVDSYADGELRHYGVTVTNSNYAIPLNKYLYHELGWVPIDAFVTETLTDEQKAAVLEGFARLPVKPQFEGSAIKIARAIVQNHPENRGQRYFDSLTPLYIVGSAYEKQTAAKRGARYLAVSFPAYDRVIVTNGYAGYRGGLRLYEDLIGQIMGVKG